MRVDRRRDDSLARAIDEAIMSETTAGTVRVWAALDRLGLPDTAIFRLLISSNDDECRRPVNFPE